MPSRTKTKVKLIIPPIGCKPRGKLSAVIPEAFAPMAVTLTTEDEVDISREDMIVRTEDVPDISDCFDAYVV